jgi:hypothetical protein
MDLPISPDDQWNVDVRWGNEIHNSADAPSGEVIASYESGDTSWYTATENASGYVLRFRDVGECVLSGDLSEMIVCPDPSGRPELLPILVAGTATAFLLALLERTVLHASAVAVDGAALAFVGQSGRGKSTLAALLCADDALLLTDDVLVVDPGPPVTCIGGATALRLRSAAASIALARPDHSARPTADERTAFAPVPAAPRSHPLASIVIPHPSRTATEIGVRRLSPADALVALLAFPRVHGWRRHDVLNRDFKRLSEVVNVVPVLEVVVPWGPPFRPGITRSLMALVQEPGRSSY